MPFIPYFTGFYAIGVQYNGAEVLIEIATGSNIYEFILAGMGTNSPQFYFSQIYELDY